MTRHRHPAADQAATTPLTAAPAAAARPLRILLVRDPHDTTPLNVETIRAGLATAGFTDVETVDADPRCPRWSRRASPT